MSIEKWEHCFYCDQHYETGIEYDLQTCKKCGKGFFANV